MPGSTDYHSGVRITEWMPTMRSSADARHIVQSVVRAFDILYAFTPERPALGVSELAAQLQLNRTTVHRLLTTLEHCGVVVQDRVTRKYRLSARVLQFSNLFAGLSDIRAVALEPMTALRDRTGETVGLHLREGMNRVVVSQVESMQGLRMTYPMLGEQIPLHLGAPGKVILAFLPDEEVEVYLAQQPLLRATTHSVTDVAQVRDALRLIRQQGFAVSHQERRLGVVSIAAPIFDSRGQPIASVNVTGPVQRIYQAEIDTYAPLVIETASAIALGMVHVQGPLSAAPSRR